MCSGLRHAAKWTPVSVTMTTGASERSLGVFVGGVAARGTAWFDAVTLVAAGSTVNVLSDPDFERRTFQRLSQ